MNEDVLSQSLIGESSEMREVRAQVAALAPLPSPVLIRGATGTGKELVARGIHLLSGRTGAFVAVNVTAIAEGTFESMMFGHVRGAFTNAIADKPGYLAEATNGTLLLDEGADMSAAAQVKLLRVLEDGKHRPVGASRDRENNCRILTATSRDFRILIELGLIREDFAERMSTFVIVLPPLSDRREDIPAIAEFHAVKFGERDGISPLRFTKDAIAALCAHDWPRNVRELRNVVERLHILCHGRVARDSDVALALAVNLPPRPPRVIDHDEPELLLAALEAARWDTSKAAKMLGVARSTIYRQVHRFGITLPRR